MKANKLARAYMCIMQNPKISDVISIYIGTGKSISKRIKSTIQKECRQRCRSIGIHYTFQNQECIQDFWIVLGTLTMQLFKTVKINIQYC